MAEEITVVDIQQDPDSGTLFFTTVINGGRQDIVIQAQAVLRKRERYGLATDAEAIDAIVREHVTRLLGLDADTHEDQRIAAAGGLRTDVTIKAGTLADMPPAPKAAPTAKEVFETELTAATTLDGVKAALAKWVAGK